MARAGKVKGQTPKVAKQDGKKKDLRGRAKKRVQYNRRYVNVVMGPGGKKVGPNSQAERMAAAAAAPAAPPPPPPPADKKAAAPKKK